MRSKPSFRNTFFMFTHPLNEYFSILLTLAGMLIYVSPQSLKQPSPICARLSGSLMLFNLTHPSKQPLGIVSSSSGSTTFFKSLQPENAFSLIVFTLFGIFASNSPVRAKQLLPITSTKSGSLIYFNYLHSKNALFSISLS